MLGSKMLGILEYLKAAGVNLRTVQIGVTAAGCELSLSLGSQVPQYIDQYLRAKGFAQYVFVVDIPGEYVYRPR